MDDLVHPCFLTFAHSLLIVWSTSAQEVSAKRDDKYNFSGYKRYGGAIIGF